MYYQFPFANAFMWKYFWNRPKYSCAEKLIKSLKINHPTVTHDDLILKETKKCYTQLYMTSCKNPNNHHIHLEHILSNNKADFCEGYIIESESKSKVVWFSMKTPGWDGLTVDFYRRLWHKVETFLTNHFIESFQKSKPRYCFITTHGSRTFRQLAPNIFTLKHRWQKFSICFSDQFN